MSWGKAANSKQTRATAPGHEIKAHWDAALGPVARVGYPWIEHHGTYRFRTQLFYNFDLDTYRMNAALNSSPFKPPLTEIDQLETNTRNRPITVLAAMGSLSQVQTCGCAISQPSTSPTICAFVQQWIFSTTLSSAAHRRRTSCTTQSR